MDEGRAFDRTIRSLVGEALEYFGIYDWCSEFFTRYVDDYARIMWVDEKDKLKRTPIAIPGLTQGDPLSPLLYQLATDYLLKDINPSDCQMHRYVDDIVIEAPNPKAGLGLIKEIQMIFLTWEKLQIRYHYSCPRRC